MTTATIMKLAGVYIMLALTTFGFIQRERASAETEATNGAAKSAFWALIWPIYWLAVVGPKNSLKTVRPLKVILEF